MIRSLRGVVAGGLALIALQTVVATRQGPGRVAGLVGTLADAVAAFVDPRRPLLSGAAAQATPSTTSTTSTWPTAAPSGANPPYLTRAGRPA